MERGEVDRGVLFPARFVSADQTIEILKAWLSTGFDGGRYVPRIATIDEESP